MRHRGTERGRWVRRSKSGDSFINLKLEAECDMGDHATGEHKPVLKLRPCLYAVVLPDSKV